MQDILVGLVCIFTPVVLIGVIVRDIFTYFFRKNHRVWGKYVSADGKDNFTSLNDDFVSKNYLDKLYLLVQSSDIKNDVHFNIDGTPMMGDSGIDINGNVYGVTESSFNSINTSTNSYP